MELNGLEILYTLLKWLSSYQYTDHFDRRPASYYSISTLECNFFIYLLLVHLVLDLLELIQLYLRLHEVAH